MTLAALFPLPYWKYLKTVCVFTIAIIHRVLKNVFKFLFLAATYVVGLIQKVVRIAFDQIIRQVIYKLDDVVISVIAGIKQAARSVIDHICQTTYKIDDGIISLVERLKQAPRYFLSQIYGIIYKIHELIIQMVQHATKRVVDWAFQLIYKIDDVIIQALRYTSHQINHAIYKLDDAINLAISSIYKATCHALAHIDQAVNDFIKSLPSIGIKLMKTFIATSRQLLRCMYHFLTNHQEQRQLTGATIRTFIFNLALPALFLIAFKMLNASTFINDAKHKIMDVYSYMIELIRLICIETLKVFVLAVLSVALCAWVVKKLSFHRNDNMNPIAAEPSNTNAENIRNLRGVAHEVTESSESLAQSNSGLDVVGVDSIVRTRNQTVPTHTQTVETSVEADVSRCVQTISEPSQRLVKSNKGINVLGSDSPAPRRKIQRVSTSSSIRETSNAGDLRERAQSNLPPTSPMATNDSRNDTIHEGIEVKRYHRRKRLIAALLRRTRTSSKDHRERVPTAVTPAGSRNKTQDGATPTLRIPTKCARKPAQPLSQLRSDVPATNAVTAQDNGDVCSPIRVLNARTDCNMESSKTSSSSHIAQLHKRARRLPSCPPLNIEESPQNPLPKSTTSAKHISSKTRARVASRKKLSQQNTNRTREGIFTTPARTIHEIDSHGRITNQADHYQDSVAASEMARPEQCNSQCITPDDLVGGPSYFPIQHIQTIERRIIDTLISHSPKSTNIVTYISSKKRAPCVASSSQRRTLSHSNHNRTRKGISATPARTIHENDSDGRITNQAERTQDSVAASEMARPEQCNSQRITPDDLVGFPSYFPVHQHNQTIPRVNHDRGTTCETARDIPAHPYDQSITYAPDSPSETDAAAGAVANSSSPPAHENDSDFDPYILECLDDDSLELWLQQQRDGISTSLVETSESTNTRDYGQTPVNATASEEVYQFEYGLLICPICNNVETRCQIFPCNDLFPCYKCAIQLYSQEIPLCPICQTEIFTIAKVDSYNIPIDYNHIYTSSGIQHIPDRSTSTPSMMNSPSTRTRTKTMKTDKGGKCDTEVHPADLSCCICLERPKNCVIHTCCHFCTCYECTLHLHERDNAKCPICRKCISTITKVDLQPASSDSVLSTWMGTSEQALSYPCFVCLKAELNCMITPCLHMCTCLDCAREIYTSPNRQCPVCNERISKITKVYVM